ncbi:MAG TPA: GspH/FimT family pseudopilin [Longimicrobium sp.]|uniref:GspH/FimT family pseudopilin n=1 Tax=Longimicrobium sp. TaxID=2029185 RepID=UPI002EDADB10
MSNPLSSRLGSRAGMTLTELMITLIVAAVILATAVPKLTSFVRQFTQRSATSQLVGDLTLARAQAVRVGRTVQLTLVDTSSYRVSYTGTTADTLVKKVTIEGSRRGVTLKPLSGGYPATVSFDSRGMRRTGSASALMVVRAGGTDTISISWVGRVYRGQQ